MRIKQKRMALLFLISMSVVISSIFVTAYASSDPIVISSYIDNFATDFIYRDPVIAYLKFCACRVNGKLG